jgi:hypothetical protein
MEKLETKWIPSLSISFLHSHCQNSAIQQNKNKNQNLIAIKCKLNEKNTYKFFIFVYLFIHYNFEKKVSFLLA